MGSNTNTFLEYICGCEKYEIYVLHIYFENHNAPTCINRNQNGFLQEIRYKITIDTITITSCKAPNPISNIIAYTPNGICNYELGEIFYPILLRPYIFNSKYYQYYFQLYFFYLGFSFCNKPYYYINIPFHHVEEDKEFYMILIYRHPVVFHICPIHYIWSIYKILIPISTSSYFTQIQLHEKFKIIVEQICKNEYKIPMNHLSTKDLVPEELWCQFQANYSYRFGMNYAMNGVFPSNNGSLEISCDPCILKNDGL